MTDKKNQPIKLSIQEIGALLVKEAKLTEGHFEIAVGFRIGVGVVGPTETDVLPGTIIGIQDISLIEVPNDKEGPMIIDASKINRKTIKKKKKEEID